MSRRNLLATAFAIISGHCTPFAVAFSSSHGQLRSPAFSRTVSYLAKLDCHKDGDSSSLSSTRRETFQKTFGSAIAIVASSLVSRPNAALAFPNKISNQYDDRPKQRGSMASVCVAHSIASDVPVFFNSDRVQLVCFHFMS